MWHPHLALCQMVRPNLSFGERASFLNSSLISCSYFVQSDSSSNISKRRPSTAICQNEFPDSSFDKHISFLKLCGFSCSSLAKCHCFRNNLAWLPLASSRQAVLPDSFLTTIPDPLTPLVLAIVLSRHPTVSLILQRDIH